jgi:hypothetical protein
MNLAGGIIYLRINEKRIKYRKAARSIIFLIKRGAFRLKYGVLFSRNMQNNGCDFAYFKK